MNPDRQFIYSIQNSAQRFGPIITQEHPNQECLKINTYSDNSPIDPHIDDIPNQFSMPQQSKQSFRRDVPASCRKLPIKSDYVQPTLASFNFMKTMKIKRIVNRFIQNIFTRSYVLPHHSKHLLNQEQYLNSATDQNDTSTQTTCFKGVRVLLPGSLILMVLDTLCILTSLLGLWLCPFVTTFPSNNFMEIQLLLILMLIADIFLNLNKAIILQGEVIQNRKTIFKAYFMGRAGEDIIGVILWILVANGQGGSTKYLIAFFQIIITIRKLLVTFENYFESLYLKGSVSNLLDLITIIIFVYYFAHIMACIWHFIGQSTQSLGNTWLIHYDLTSQNQWVQYNYSFYWATMTMVTVGYGDITPQNQVEMVFTNIMMFLSSCMFAYSMNSIGMILKNVQDSKLSLKRSLILINNFMSRNKVERQIQSRVRNYLKYRNIESEQSDSCEELQNLIVNLPSGLQTDLNNDIQIQILQNMTSISKNFGPSTLQQLVNHIQMIRFTPGDVIYHQNDSSQLEMKLYFIQEGCCEAFEERSQCVIERYKKGNCFGEYQFFTNNVPKISVRSAGFCTIYFVPRIKFLEIISQNSKEFEKFHSIKDQIIFENNFADIKVQCKNCDQFDHPNSECPLMHYYPDIEQRILKQRQDQIHNLRRQFERHQRRINTKMIFREINQTINDYACDHGSLELLKQSERYVATQQAIYSSANIKTHQNLLERNKSDLDQQISHIYSPKSQINIIKKKKTYIDNSQKQIKGIKQMDQNSGLVPVESLKLIREINMLDQLFNKLQFHKNDIDKIQSFSEFKPQNNITTVLKLYAKQSNQQSENKHRKFYKYLGRYTISDRTKTLLYKVKSKINGRTY